MSNIESNLETIQKGVYGKDVRRAIHDAIEECYSDGHAGAIDLIARERINTLIGGTGDLVEVPLFEELELFAYDQTFTIDPDEHLISDFDYIAIYYKVVSSGAPEVKWYKSSDFLTLPIVISGVFLENAGHKLSAREIHIRCTDSDDQTFEVYLANNWKLNGSDAADGGTYTEVEATDEEKAGVISMISGIKFAPSTEVADIRVGEDGTTYTSAGEAVRAQISDVKSELTNGIPYAVKVALNHIIQNVAFKNDTDYSADKATINAWATSINVTSIAAVYEQSGTVYTTDSLDVLRDDLTVTAYYDNGTSAVVNDYTLSGTLTVGTSAITVSYGGESTTFNVTVSALNAYWDIGHGFYQKTVGANTYLLVTESATNARAIYVRDDAEYPPLLHDGTPVTETDMYAIQIPDGATGVRITSPSDVYPAAYDLVYNASASEKWLRLSTTGWLEPATASVFNFSTSATHYTLSCKHGSAGTAAVTQNDVNGIVIEYIY